MTFTLRPHDWKRNKKNQVVLVRSSPYIRLHVAGEPPVYVQGGSYYTDDGKELDKVPEWVQDELKKVPFAIKKEVGLVGTGKN